MLRLVEIPDGTLDRDDLAMWCIFFPETMGFGYVPQFVISGYSVSSIFEGNTIKDTIFESQSVIGTAWITPDSVTDPQTGWTNEANTIDGDTGTYASAIVQASSSSEYLHFHLTEPQACSHIRLWALWSLSAIAACTIDVYYDGAWHNMYDGPYKNNVWSIIPVGGSMPVPVGIVINEFRIKFSNVDPVDWWTAVLYEVDFGIPADVTRDVTVLPILEHGLRVNEYTYA